MACKGVRGACPSCGQKGNQEQDEDEDEDEDQDEVLEMSSAPRS